MSSPRRIYRKFAVIRRDVDIAPYNQDVQMILIKDQYNLEQLGLVEKQERFNLAGENISNLYIIKSMTDTRRTPSNASDNLSLESLVIPSSTG